MFVLTTIVDTIRIPSSNFGMPTLKAIHSEIDLKYPNRVLMDIGLVICRYGDCLKITNGSCVPGDGGSHHESLFRLVVFRPFVEEVCLGKIVKSTADGIQVSLGFFQDIFIPAYWMLRPTHYEEKTGLWVWTPNYDDDDDDDDDDKNESNEQENRNDNGNSQNEATATKIKNEDNEVEDDVGGDIDDNGGGDDDDGENDKNNGDTEAGETGEEEEGDRFEMEIGAEIRFKVKSIHFTQVTNTAKGLQATTTTTAYSHSPTSNYQTKDEPTESTAGQPLRKRSTSVDLSETQKLPASMHIVASICEDGLGLTSWWTTPADEEEEDDDEREEGEDEEE